HVRHGHPRALLKEAAKALEQHETELVEMSPILLSDPVGPSLRRYANAAALVETGLEPEKLLAALQEIERMFGRRRSGQRWRARTLDLDVILWSGGPYVSPQLTIPHPLFRQREFVLRPAA